MTSIRGLYTGGAEDCVYFEHQSKNTRQCGLHCLNNLLQGPVFTEAELRQIGRTFDRAEQMMLSAAGGDSYAQASHDGYYGLDVIVAALQTRSFVMKHMHSPEFRDILTNPTRHSDAFILNLRDHWLAVRPVKGRWFSLDSLSTPEPISESRINSFVTTLQDQSWTLFVVRPTGWPSRKMPEPTPKSDSGIPRIDDGSAGLRPAAYYSFSAISRLSAARDDAGGGSFTAAPPGGEALGTTGPAERRQWPSGGGRTLDPSAAASPNRHQDDQRINAEEDPELAEVIRQSIKDFKQSIAVPSPEPVEGGLLFKLTDMTTTGGSRGVFVTRRFSHSAKIIELFNWLFKADDIWPNATVALGACENVVLTAQYPNRTFKCVRGRKVLFCSGAYSASESTCSPFEDLSEKSLSDVFQSGGENLRLVDAD